MKYDYITIGIIARNEEKTLPITLSYLLQQTYPLEYIEIIIADGNSDDNTTIIAEEFLSKAKIQYQIINERDVSDPVGVGYGHSRGRNVVLMNTNNKSKYIARIDADCRADKNRLMNLWTIIKNNTDSKIAGAGGTRFVETQGVISQKELVLNYYFTSNIISLGNPAFTPKKNIITIPSVAGYNSIFKKEIFDTYQYDSTFPFNIDDLEMNFRLRKKGYKFLYAKDSIIYHRGEETIVGFLKQMYNYGKGVAYTMRIHRTPLVRLYAWIGLGYVSYTILLPLLGYGSYLLLGAWYYVFIPYILLLLLGVAVLIEVYYKTKSLTSLIVIPTFFAHLRYYGIAIIKGLLEDKKSQGKQ